MTRFIIALLLLSSIASAEQIRYRATGDSEANIWAFHDGPIQTWEYLHTFTIPVEVDYSVDTTANMWRPDSLNMPSIESLTPIASEWLHFDAGLSIDPTDVDLPAIGPVADPHDGNGIGSKSVLTASSATEITFADPLRFSPFEGSPQYDVAMWISYAWAADPEVGIALSPPDLNSVQLATTSRRLRRNCRFAGLDFCGTDGLAMSAAIAAVPEPSSLSLVLAVVGGWSRRIAGSPSRKCQRGTRNSASEKSV